MDPSTNIGFGLSGLDFGTPQQPQQPAPKVEQTRMEELHDYFESEEKKKMIGITTRLNILLNFSIGLGTLRKTT